MASLSGGTKKIIPLLILFMLLFSMAFSFSSETTKADGAGVGVEAVRPRIADIELRQNIRGNELYLDVIDLNGWAFIHQVRIELYSNDELQRQYLFNQTEDLERSFSTPVGDGLMDFEVYTSEEDKVEDRITMELYFKFSHGDYDTIVIRAFDRAYNEANSTIEFAGIAAGQSYTAVFLAAAGAGAVGLAYKAYKDSGGAIGG